MAPLAEFQLNVGVSVVKTGPGELLVPGELIVGGLAPGADWQNSDNNVIPAIIEKVLVLVIMMVSTLAQILSKT